jgi:hypothetical protein
MSKTVDYHKGRATSVRFTDADRGLVEQLRERLAPDGLDRLTLHEVLQIAVRRLAAAELGAKGRARP